MSVETCQKYALFKGNRHRPSVETGSRDVPTYKNWKLEDAPT